MIERIWRRILLVIIFSFFLAACSSIAKTTENPTATINTSGVWRVTRPTGLYEKPNVDAEQVTILPAGERVKDIGSNDYLSKCIVVDREMDIIVCHVVVESTGEDGWVLKKVLE